MTWIIPDRSPPPGAQGSGLPWGPHRPGLELPVKSGVRATPLSGAGSDHWNGHQPWALRALPVPGPARPHQRTRFPLWAAGPTAQGTAAPRGPSCGIWMQLECQVGPEGSNRPWGQALPRPFCRAHVASLSPSLSFLTSEMGAAIPLPALGWGQSCLSRPRGPGNENARVQPSLVVVPGLHPGWLRWDPL